MLRPRLLPRFTHVRRPTRSIARVRGAGMRGRRHFDASFGDAHDDISLIRADFALLMRLID